MLLWIFGIVSTLGIVGTIAACVLAPAIAIPIVQSIASAILRCKPCLIALALIAALVAGAVYGSHYERVKCRAGELAARLAAQTADLNNALKSAADEADRANTIEATADVQKKNDAAYIATLQARPACALDDNDVGGLSNRRSKSDRTKPSTLSR